MIKKLFLTTLVLASMQSAVVMAMEQEAEESENVLRDAYDHEMERTLKAGYPQEKMLARLTQLFIAGPSKKGLCEALMTAFMRKKEEAAYMLVQNGAPAEWDDQKRDYYFPLKNAAALGWVSICELLISRGANVNRKNDSSGSLEYPTTALAAAVLKGQGRTVAFLLHRKAEPNDQDRFGATALHYAAYGAQVRLQEGEEQSAVESNVKTIIQTLLDHGANKNSLDKRGKTAYEYFETWELLKPDDHTNNHKQMLNRKLLDLIQHPRSIRLAEEQRLQHIQDLLDQGADPSASEMLNEKTIIDALTLAIQESWPSTDNRVAKLLLERGAHIDENHLLAAATRGNEDLCKMLIAKGINVARIDISKKNAALFDAAGKGLPEGVTCLLWLGASPHALSASGCTALHIAACIGSDEDPENYAKVCKILIAHGADKKAVITYGANKEADDVIEGKTAYDLNPKFEFLKPNEEGT